MEKRVLAIIAFSLIPSVLAATAPWMVKGFKVSYYQEVKNSGLLALRGKALYSNITIEVVDVLSSSELKIRMYGNVTLVGAKTSTQEIDRTITVNLNDRNVSLPMLTEEKLNQTLSSFPSECKNDTCVIYLNQTQQIPERNMIIIIKGKTVLDKKLLLVKESDVELDVYMSSGATQRIVGKSISRLILTSYYFPHK
ncbi:hypothetical protein EYM_00325 [Ignicoccus islandicus DSM 13165]|uniref:Uncharacterized protein n=1 Tax=Ignicoccus islandicus DSM 13165 TaxID=940295 RepID=A0A0U3DX77_9CREN|nr:hypothetical protein [Ignicoccus islandicus]ALU12106.1 hypothetical protein EYM_00325 [Ignicoccus islandicus DSM 13165]